MKYLEFISFILVIHVTYTRATNNRKKFLDDIYQGCNTEIRSKDTFGDKKLCFGVFGPKCIRDQICAHGVTISENETSYNVIQFDYFPSNEFLDEYEYNYLVGIDPFVNNNNGMNSSSPECKKILKPSDFILRIFRISKERNENSEADQKVKVGWRKNEYFPLIKSEWNSFCKKQIIGEYLSRKTIYDTNYIVFNKKFYYDVTGTYSIPDRLVEDFKDPEKYQTTDAQFFINFDPKYELNISKALIEYNSGFRLSNNQYFKTFLMSLFIFYILLLI